MRSVGIVGAGQSGLQLAFALRGAGYDVTLYSDRRPEEILGSRLPSSTGLYHRALDNERELGICLWDGEEPLMDRVFTTIAGPDGDPVVEWTGRLTRHGQAVDQRLKFSTWLELFAEEGGRVVYGPVDLAGLEDIAATHELTLVSAGKGEISGLFELDEARTVYNRPQRSIGMCALIDVEHPAPDGVAVGVAPGVGEAFGIPMLTAAGSAIAWVLEAVPGSPMDRWSQATSPTEMRDLALKTFAEFFPWESARHADARLADDNAWLCGAVPPRVRRPIATLPSGRTVLGVGDVVVLNDPCTGQGGNNASHHAKVVGDMIVEHGDQPYDQAWMQRTFDKHWEYAQYPTRFTNTMLAPLDEHVLALHGAATQLPEVANRITNGFSHPEDFSGFFYDEALAKDFLAGAEQRGGLRHRHRAAVGAR